MKKLTTTSLLILIASSGIFAGCIDLSSIISSNSVTAIDYLQNIPQKPNDFDLVMRDLNTRYIELCDLSEAYYLQPEFYGDSWTRGNYFYTNHDYSRWAVHGHGAFPANMMFQFGDPTVGAWISDCLFYRTGWGVETYQGIKLVPAESEYFDITITPDEFLLPPTYPVFSEGWVKRLTITVSIKKTPPAGTYILNVDSHAPSVENSTKWYKEVFVQNMTVEQQQMIDECINQGGTDCEELIEISRRNRYIDGGMFQMGSRIVLTVIVPEI